MIFIKRYLHPILLLIMINVINWFSASPDRVEYYYSRKFYPAIVAVTRFFLGWIPFSIGDVIYTSVIIFCLYFSFKKIRIFLKSNNKLILFKSGFGHLLLTFGWAWVIFQVLWGINYNRPSIGQQFDIPKSSMSQEDLRMLTAHLVKEANSYALGRKITAFSNVAQVEVIQKAYDSLSKVYAFLTYKNPSFKKSLFGVIGNYMGYGGYYNPFSGEAQVNDKLPVFGIPYTCAHEVAHQLGFAKESEANFIGYLAALHSSDSSLLYAANLDIFLYANSALRRQDSAAARLLFEKLSPIAKSDLKEYSKFIKKYQGPIDEFTTRFYTQFLHINNQPEGMQSYSRVVGWVWSYMKKTAG